MATLPLPEKSVRLTAPGFKVIYEQIRVNRETSRLVADELESNPRDVLRYLFKLTKRQAKTIDGITDEDLRGRTSALISELRSGGSNAFEFRPAARKKDPHPEIAPGRGPVVIQIEGNGCGAFIVLEGV